jgi:hypothetical protein
MKKVVKKMAKGGAKKSSVPTPGMAYKQKGTANQLAMATGIPAGSKSVKPKTKTPVSKGSKTEVKNFKDSGKDYKEIKNINSKGTTTTVLKQGSEKPTVLVEQKNGSKSIKGPSATNYFKGHTSKSGTTTIKSKDGDVTTYNSKGEKYKKTELNKTKTTPAKTLTKLPEVTVTAKRKTSTPVTKKPVPTTPKKTLTKLPEVTVTAKRKESTVAPKTKTVTKPASGSATNTSAGKTVAQMWQEKTGTSWSEAKKQGLTDGSAKGNMKLMADMKANPSNFSKRDAVPEKLPTISLSKAAESLSSSRTTPELAKPATPVKTEKQSLGARIKSKIGQMKKGGMVKKKK